MTQTLERSLRSKERLEADQMQELSYRCAELALLSLTTSDLIDDEGAPGDKLLRQKLASALRQMAVHFLIVVKVYMKE